MTDSRVTLGFTFPDIAPLSLVAVTLQDLEGLWFMALFPFTGERAYGPRDEQARSWAPPLLADPPRPYEASTDLPFPHLQRVEAGSLEILMQLPWEAYATAAATFIGSATLVFGAPMRAAAQWQGWRHQFWEHRLAADSAKRAWIQQRHDWNQAAGVRLAVVESPPLPPLPTSALSHDASAEPESEVEDDVDVHVEAEEEEDPPPMMLA